MKDVGAMTQAEVAALVGSHLMKKGIEVVLSGGACVEYYSSGRYTSLDIDFVNLYFASREKIAQAMSELGFSDTGKHFEHPDTTYLVEFPPGPIGIGEEPPGEIAEVQETTGVFRILSATDCVKDRLIQYYHWDDPQCLEQAVMVAKSNDVDLNEIERWSAVEGKRDVFNKIKARLS